jgi:hypothetical protein
LPFLKAHRNASLQQELLVCKTKLARRIMDIEHELTADRKPPPPKAKAANGGAEDWANENGGW